MFFSYFLMPGFQKLQSFSLRLSCLKLKVEVNPTQVCSTKEVNCSLLQALYDHLMDFLADRGVDNTFADELIELSTALEHQEYIKFLEDLKSFVKCQ